MSTILITGTTGNVASEVIRFLFQNNTTHKIVAGVRDIEKAKQFFRKFPKLEFVHFDFENAQTFENALVSVDKIFLLRPPHISDVEKYFKPLIASLQKNKICQVMFLSVQGAEKSKIIPHHKIEKMVVESNLSYIFLRPSYFMQNLTTTLLNDIKTKREIILPSKNAKFNWIDIENIGEAAAVLLEKFEHYKNNAFEITGLENENFETVTSMINQVVENPIRFRAVNPLKFYSIKKQEGMQTGLILVMIMLHSLPRFQKQAKISSFYEHITGKKPTTLLTFINREKQELN